MNTGERMTDRSCPPDARSVGAWLGVDAAAYWERLTNLIAEEYPGVFTPEWLYGGKKHGWSLRYKKNKSFCTLIPEKNRCALVIVFGAEERKKVEDPHCLLSGATRLAYDAAATYHDGKWLLLAVDGEEVLRDIKILLAVKRKPGPPRKRA